MPIQLQKNYSWYFCSTTSYFPFLKPTCSAIFQICCPKKDQCQKNMLSCRNLVLLVQHHHQLFTLNTWDKMTTWECYCSTLSVTIAAPPEILCSLYLHWKNRYVSTIAAPWCYYCSTIKSILCFFNGKMPTCDWYWWYYCSTTIFTTCRTNKQFDKIIRFETKDFSRFRGLLSVSFFQKKLSSNPFLFLIFKFWAKVKKTLALSLPAENQQED